MKNYIIALFVIVVLIILSVIVWKSGSQGTVDMYDDIASNPEVLNTTEPSQSTVEETQNINNVDNKKITKEMKSATISTNMGSITIEFFSSDAPKTVENFTKLVSDGFYDGVKFHRVIKGFMIQGGDPNSKDDGKMATWGSGGPGYKFNDEIDAKSDLYTKVGYQKGIVAMANSGPNTNGSQFFIMHADYPLPPLYTIFGKVVAGQDVVDKIALVKTGANDRPIDPVVIKSIILQ